MNSWHQTKYESFDAPQEFVVVQPQIIVREDVMPLESNRIIKTFGMGDTVRVVGRCVVIIHHRFVILRLKVPGLRWISQKCIQYRTGKTVFVKPKDETESGVEIAHCLRFPNNDNHKLRPFLPPNKTFTCDICGDRVESVVMSCRLCNWDVCDDCRNFFAPSRLSAASFALEAYNGESLETRASPNAYRSIGRSVDEDVSPAVLGAIAAGVIGMSLLSAALQGSQKVSSSYMKYSNDFELVIRATKDLGRLLETHFGAPEGATLAAQIESVSNDPVIPLSYSTYTKMKALVQTRNNLVHQYGFDQLGERGRKEFAETIDAVVEELQEILEPNKSQQESNEDCIVM